MTTLFQRLIAFSLIFTINSIFNVALAASTQQPITIKILGVNDFHGQISTGRKFANRPIGGTAVYAAYLRAAEQNQETRTVIALMGDLVGASVPASGLLNHESSILFLNQLANSYCHQDDRYNAKCNLVATVGNHEFDRGQQALFNLIYGTHQAPTNHWIDMPEYPGTNFSGLVA